MSRQTNVLLLLLTICVAAGALAVFVHDMNTTFTSLTPPVQVTQTPQPKPNEPLHIDQVATGTAGQAIPESRSEDGVTSVVPEFALDRALPNPFTFHGTTTAFESTASWKLIQQGGKVLGSGFFSVASPDVGIPGPFRVTGFYDAIPSAASGTLRVYEASAKDGTPIHVVDIPVALSQATTTVQVFFGNASKGSDMDCAKVFGLEHAVVASAAGDRVLGIHELLKGPTPYERAKGYSSALPDGVHQPDIIERDAHAVEAAFDDTVQQGVAGSCRVTAIRSQIERTVVQRARGVSVVITVDGASEGILQP